MLKKLKTKFLIATLIVLIIVIGVIVGAINVFNYRSVISDADDTLSVIMDNAGHFPSKPGHIDPEFDINFTPESPFEARYFTVTLIDTMVKSVNTASIAAIDDTTAVKMAVSVKFSGIERGFRGNYRYLMTKDGNETSVIFLDCTETLDSARTFLLLSMFISVLGILGFFLILWIVSNRIILPIMDGYEKQKRFITDAGHDIKTPITIIDADAELLEMDIGENEWLSDIKKQTSRLASLTSDLIYLSRTEERENMPHIDFPFSDLTEEVILSFYAPARTKNIVINHTISPAVFYCGEEESIRKLVTILMDNAIKYSPEGEEIIVNLKKQGRSIILKISNKAENLSDESIDHIFDRFYRSDPARSTSGGFGIGLSVANAIVSSHKGRISAQKHGDILTIEVVL